MNLNNINIISAPKMGLSSEQVKQILEEYYSGKLASEIEQAWNLKAGTIKYFRKKMGLPKYENPKFSDEYLAKAVNEHINGTLLKDVYKKYNLSSATIYRYMKQHNIEYKNEHGRKNKFNQDYFESIDTEHKAYWLGFIYADGSVLNTGSGNTKTNRLQINISNKDIELLIAFCDDIEYDKSKIQTYAPKGTYSTNLMSKLSINSVKLCSDLAKWGVYPNKTGSLISLPNISEELMPHFIRGFFDGDGCITTGPQFSIIGDYDFLYNIQTILIENCKINRTKLLDYPHKNADIYDLVYGGKNNCKKIYLYLYTNANIFLKRKHDKFITLIS